MALKFYSNIDVPNIKHDDEYLYGDGGTLQLLETTITEAINNAKTELTEAINTVSSSLSTETTARTAKDTELSGQISVINSRLEQMGFNGGNKITCTSNNGVEIGSGYVAKLGTVVYGYIKFLGGSSREYQTAYFSGDGITLIKQHPPRSSIQLKLFVLADSVGISALVETVNINLNGISLGKEVAVSHRAQTDQILYFCYSRLDGFDPEDS